MIFFFLFSLIQVSSSHLLGWSDSFIYYHHFPLFLSFFLSVDIYCRFVPFKSLFRGQRGRLGGGGGRGGGQPIGATGKKNETSKKEQQQQPTQIQEEEEEEEEEGGEEEEEEKGEWTMGWIGKSTSHPFFHQLFHLVPFFGFVASVSSAL